MSNVALLITTLTTSFAPNIVAHLIRKGFSVGSIGGDICSSEGLCAMVTLNVTGDPEELPDYEREVDSENMSEDEFWADHVMDEAESVLQSLDVKWFSMVAVCGEYSSFMLGNVVVQEDKKEVTPTPVPAHFPSSALISDHLESILDP